MPNKPKKIRRGTYAAAEQSERDRVAYNKRQEEMKKQQRQQSQSDDDEEERSKWARTAEQRRQRQQQQQQEQQAHQESERRQRAEWKEQQREQSRQQQQQQQQQQPRHRMTQRRLQCLRILGLTAQQDTIAEIKKAYRRLALANHPDHGGNPERMKSINAANDFLAADDDE